MDKQTGFSPRMKQLVIKADEEMQDCIETVNRFAESLCVVHDPQTLLTMLKESQEVKELVVAIRDFWPRWVLYGRLMDLLTDYGEVAGSESSAYDTHILVYYYALRQVEPPLADRIKPFFVLCPDLFPLAAGVGELLE